MVVVDVHDEEEDATGQDHGARHEEKVLVVLEDVHQEPCNVRKAGMEKGIGFRLCLTNKQVLHHNRQNPTFPHSQTSVSTTKPRFGFGASVRDGEIDCGPS